MVHCRNFPEVHIRVGQKIHREGGESERNHGVGEPKPARVEINADEADDGKNHHGERHMGPAHDDGETGRSLSPHYCELERAVGGRRYCEDEKQQVGVLRSLFLPDEQMHDAEREARRDHRDPRDLDPVHVAAANIMSVPWQPRLMRTLAPLRPCGADPDNGAAARINQSSVRRRRQSLRIFFRNVRADCHATS